MIIALLILAVFLVSAVWLWRRPNRSLKSLPSPPGSWLLGHVPQVLKAVRRKQFYGLLSRWSQEYGPIYLIWAGSPVLVLSKPLVIENAIIEGMKDGSLIRSESANRAWNDIAGPILLGLGGEEWLWRRKAWNPEFSASGLSNYWSVIDEACAHGTRKLELAVNSNDVYVDSLFVEVTMRLIACLLLGIPVSCNTSTAEGPPLDVSKIYESMTILGHRFLRLATGEPLWKKYLPFPSSRKYWAAIHCLQDFLAPRVDIALDLRDHPIDVADSVSQMFKESMLVKIASKENRYTRNSLIAESILMLIAGTDTTAHTMSFAMGTLAAYPSVLQKAQVVVDRVCAEHGGITMASLRDLVYIRAIVRETLRLFPVGSGSTSLQAARQTSLEGIVIPKGTQIFWSMVDAGRDPEVYPQPEEFRPERWLDEGVGVPAPPILIFGSGAHRCLGEHLAMVEATVMLAQLIRRFRWELVNGRSSLDHLEQNLLMYPADGMPLRFHFRENVTAEDPAP